MSARLQPHSSAPDKGQVMMNAMDAVASANTHIGVVDALFRFAAGTDDSDVAALNTAFVDKALVEFGACGRARGLDFEPLRGAATITRFLGGTSMRQVTSHVVTNPRVRMAGDRARLRALVDATHIVRINFARRFRMMNWYDADLVSAGELWRIERMAISNIWFEGDPEILTLREGPAW